MEEAKMNMKEHAIFAYNTIKYTFSNSRITPCGGLLIPGQMLQAIDFDTKIDKYSSPSKEYKNSDVLKSMLIGILCGNTGFESIHETDDDPEFFCNAFHMRHIPSERVYSTIKLLKKSVRIPHFQKGKFLIKSGTH